jgi:putative chitinase
MTPQQFATATGASVAVAASWLPSLDLAMQRYQINTPQRQAAFLSQIGVESAGLTELVENLNYSEQALLLTWPDHFNAVTSAAYGRTASHPADQVMIANIAYGGRMGNGNAESGDGFRFRGRGAIQLTGRANYREAGIALGLPLDAEPDQAAQPHAAALVAAWYWWQHGCNAMADAGLIDAITQSINGGTNGLPERQRLYAAAGVALEA